MTSYGMLLDVNVLPQKSKTKMQQTSIIDCKFVSITDMWSIVVQVLGRGDQYLTYTDTIVGNQIFFPDE